MSQHVSPLIASLNLPQMLGPSKEESEDRVFDPTPFVKWVGGKRSLLREIHSRLPQKLNAYYEPFVGGGALFFSLCSKIDRAWLSDTNIDLLIAYRAIQEAPDAVIGALSRHEKKHCSDYYYSVREKHELVDPIETAARLIYLNKTCFNGLYRVNSKGNFNVPIGSYKTPCILNEKNIKACSKALVHASIRYGDFDSIKPGKGDFVYFDPPYHAAASNSFTRYSQGDFSEGDQKRLAEFFGHLSKKGVYVMLSNSDTELIRDLYCKFNISTVEAPRYVNCKADKRGNVTELLITNY